MPDPINPPALPSLNDLIDRGNDPTPPTPPVIIPPVPTVPPTTTPPADPPVPAPPATTDPPADLPVDPNAPVDPPVDSDADPDAELTVEDFYKQVDALHGQDIFGQIQYGETDPMSPEGVKMRDDYIAAKAADDLEKQIAAADPRAYAYLLHRQNGGSDDDFFQIKSFVLPAMDKLEESVDLQRTVYSEALKAKGSTEKQIATLLKASIDSKELLDDAKAAWKEISDRDKDIATKASKAHAETVKQHNTDLQMLSSAVNQVLTNSNDFGYQVPDTDKAAFEQAFKDSVYYENGQFWLMKPITTATLPKIMETELFGHLGGKLGKMIEKKAQTVSAQRFITKAKAGEAKPKGAPGENTTKTLGEL